jgi:AcrR family transcriptional regulator
MYDMPTSSTSENGPGRGRRRRQDRSRLSEIITEEVTEAISGSVIKKIDRKLDRTTQLQHLDRLADGLESLALWLRDEPGTRRTRWSRDEIARAALRLVDAEGIGNLSMRRLATELGAGTMTLYHYVKTKDEVLALMEDAVMAEVVVPEDDLVDLDWRATLRAIANRTRDALTRHPWVLDAPDRPSYGPNTVRHIDQALGALAGLPLDLRTKTDIITSVDEYVFGYCLHRRNEAAGRISVPPEGSAGDGETSIGSLLTYIDELVADGGYPNLKEVLDTYAPETALLEVQATVADPDRFERNLDRLLAGIAADFGI